MVEQSNLDFISAEIGFNTCELYANLCHILEDKIKKYRNYNDFKENVKSIIDAVKEKAKINDCDFVENIFNEIVIKKIENSKNPEKSFKNLIDNPPKFDAKEMERIINKSLGILIEDGLFAYAIWLESENKDPHKVITISSLKILNDTNLVSNQNNIMYTMLEISTSIQKTLLARQLLERMLVYARYRAKALQKGSD